MQAISEFVPLLRDPAVHKPAPLFLLRMQHKPIQGHISARLAPSAPMGCFWIIIFKHGRIGKDTTERLVLLVSPTDQPLIQLVAYGRHPSLLLTRKDFGQV